MRKNLLYTLLLQLVNISYGFIVPALLIRKYGSDLNGLTSSIIQIIGYMKIIEAGLSVASIKQLYNPIANNDKILLEKTFLSIDVLFKKVSYIFILSSSIVAIGYTLLIDSSYSHKYLITLIIVMSLSAFFEFYKGTAYYTFFVSSEKIQSYLEVQIVIQILKVLLIVIMANLRIDPILLFFIISLTSLLKGLLLQRKFKKETGIINSRTKILKKEMVRIENTSFVFTHQILGLVVYNSPIILSGVFFSLKQASVYSVHEMIFGMFYMLGSLVFNQSLSPVFGNLIEKGNKIKLRNKFEEFSKIYFLIIFASFITLIMAFKNFLYIYLGNESSYYFSIELLSLFSIQTLFNCLKLPYQSLINSFGDFKKTIKYSFIETLLFVGVFFLLYKFDIGYLSINIALISAFLFKYISYRNFVNKHYFYLGKKDSFFQIISLIIVFIILIKSHVFQLEKSNILIWTFQTSVIFLLSCGSFYFIRKIIFLQRK